MKRIVMIAALFLGFACHVRALEKAETPDINYETKVLADTVAKLKKTKWTTQNLLNNGGSSELKALIANLESKIEALKNAAQAQKEMLYREIKALEQKIDALLNK